MIKINKFVYKPEYHEEEYASNSYVMSLVAIAVGLPFPIVNLLTTLIFYLANRKRSYFIRWHCTQALLSQLFLFFANSYSFWWTVSIIFTDETVSNDYFAYILTVFLFNFIEFIATIYTAIKVRKGIHVEWWFYSDITNLIVKPKI
ncbi:MAG: DUF4870 domain-containing protein [Flavobacteriaceae bacterium]|nr:DUF4870 domain-containing protein [Flavobacteriaceae bacterium]